MNNRDWRGYLKSMANVNTGGEVNSSDKIEHLVKWLLWTQYGVKLQELPGSDWRGDIPEYKINKSDIRAINRDKIYLTIKYICMLLRDKKYLKKAILGYLDNDCYMSDIYYPFRFKILVYLASIFTLILGSLLYIPLCIIASHMATTHINIIAVLAIVLSSMVVTGIIVYCTYRVSEVVIHALNKIIWGLATTWKYSGSPDDGLDDIFVKVNPDKLLLFNLMGYIAPRKYSNTLSTITPGVSIGDVLVRNHIINESKLADFDSFVVRAQINNRRDYLTECYYGDVRSIKTKTLNELNTIWLKESADTLVSYRGNPVNYVEPWNSKFSSDEYFKDSFNLKELEKLEAKVNGITDRLFLPTEYGDKLSSYFEYQEDHSTQFARFYKTNQLLEKVYASIADFDNKVVYDNLDTISENAKIAIDSGMQIVKNLENSEINRMDKILREQAYIKDDINSEDSKDE